MVRRFFNIFLLLFGVTTFGTIGYILIENWNVFDSFYMTVITISTVGFGEVHELTTAGRLFTSLLLITSIGSFAYAISSFTNYLMGGEYTTSLREYKFKKKLNKMENHIIICGFGRVGRQVAEDLLFYKKDFVIIEKDDLLVKDYLDKPGYTFVKGDATKDDVFLKAEIKKARAVISCLPKDADNVYVVLAAREKCPKVEIIVRATSSEAVSKLKMAGADQIILPAAIGGSHMASLITNPTVSEFMNMVKTEGTTGVNIESISFNELPEEFQNKTIGELEVKRQTGVTIIGFKTPTGEYIINPDWSMKVLPKSQLFVLGSTEQIQKFNQLFEIHQS
jgi:voltage-gated potassium channel